MLQKCYINVTTMLQTVKIDHPFPFFCSLFQCGIKYQRSGDTVLPLRLNIHHSAANSLALFEVVADFCYVLEGKLTDWDKGCDVVKELNNDATIVNKHDGPQGHVAHGDLV